MFLRQGRSVVLTDAGRALLRHAERILEEEMLARRAVQEVVGLARGQFTLWTLPTPGQHLLPPLLADFRRAYPHIAISLRETVPARAVAEAVDKGRADIGIVHLPYQVEGLEERILLKEELALVVPDSHPFAKQGVIALAAASGEDFIWAPEGATSAHPLYAACLAAGYEPHIACVSGSAQGMQALVAAGLGIALLPRLAIHAPPGTCVVELELRPGPRAPSPPSGAATRSHTRLGPSSTACQKKKNKARSNFMFTSNTVEIRGDTARIVRAYLSARRRYSGLAHASCRITNICAFWNNRIPSRWRILARCGV